MVKSGESQRKAALLPLRSKNAIPEPTYGMPGMAAVRFAAPRRQ